MQRDNRGNLLAQETVKLTFGDSARPERRALLANVRSLRKRADSGGRNLREIQESLSLLALACGRALKSTALRGDFLDTLPDSLNSNTLGLLALGKGI